MKLWEKAGEKGGRPRLVYENHAMPVFYRDVMYREGAEGKDDAYLKLYDGHDWKWFCVRLSHTDMEYLRKNWKGRKASAPTLERRRRKYFLRFSYTEEAVLTKTSVKDQIICSVDLGINTDAVCTVMQSDGTVLGRRFINFPSEKDRLYRTLGRIRRFQRAHGPAQSRGRWAYTKRLNIELGRKIAGAIVNYAEESPADLIVFEHLEMHGKISGKKKQKLHLWRKQISRSGVGTRHTGKGCVYPMSVHGIPAGLHMMGPGWYPVIPKITASVHSGQGKDITVTCQRRIILVQDILSGNF